MQSDCAHCAKPPADGPISVKIITIHEPSPVTKNSIHESLTASTCDTKWSITSICIAKHNAPANRSKSEPLSENAPFMHRKYMPISAINTPIHILAPHFLLRKIPSIGTISIYVAVRKPALPDSAPMLIPSCCRLLAKKSAIPQQLPDIQSSFFCFLLSGLFTVRSFLSSIFMTGRRQSAPIRKRMPLNENAPTASPPFDCATKAIPQTISAKNKIKTCLVFEAVFIIIVPPCYQNQRYYITVCLELHT